MAVNVVMRVCNHHLADGTGLRLVDVERIRCVLCEFDNERRGRMDGEKTMKAVRETVGMFGVQIEECGRAKLTFKGAPMSVYIAQDEAKMLSDWICALSVLVMEE